MWTLVAALVTSMMILAKASQLVVPSHTVKQGEVEAKVGTKQENNYHHYEVGDTVQLRCLGGNLGWEGDDGRYEEVAEAASATSITITRARAEDTGLFTCGRAELGEEVDSVYLWVENPRQLFRDSSPMLFTNVEVKHPKFVKAISVFCKSKAGTDMAVGCRASSPRVTVRVERNG